ncbi:MAG: hypothetical protein ABI353_11465 [Isosphaeraceae bacterium]
MPAAVVPTPAKIAPVFPGRSRIRSYIAAEALSMGDPVYQTTAGRAGKADAATSGKQQFRGVALNKAGVSQAVEVLEEGEVGGFDLSGSVTVPDALVYLGAAGAYSDTANVTKTVVVGRVKVLTDDMSAPTRVLHVYANENANW